MADLRRKGTTFFFAYILAAVSVLILSGCQLQKTNIVTEKSENAMELVKLKQSEADVDKMTEQFLGMPYDTAKEYDVRKENKEAFQFRHNGLELLISPLDEGGIVNEVSVCFYDHNENAAYAYENLIYRDLVENAFSQYYNAVLRECFPEEKLDSCSKEEVLRFCNPFANACGYTDTDVMVFALQEQQLQNMSTHSGIWNNEGSDGKRIWEGAPDPKAKLVYRESDLEEKDPLPWSKKDEAFLVYYRADVGGKAVDGSSQNLYMVYVPARKGIVFAKGYIKMDYENSGTKKDVISSELAISKVMQENGISAEEDIEVLGVQLVYAANYDEFHKEALMYPYWQVDFKIKNHKGSLPAETTLVHAVSGQIYSDL